ncbi:MAG: prolyl oligopeptidase family serine peptidase, partial [Bacteroidales bacterium]|nr:prolyl oligopeptidase family serine peptidase [Bacteroidales bacterium]
YLITRTNIYKAAGAGAPVGNMTSAYGGIRWESGHVRAMQYEHGQSRIGKSIWDEGGLDLYIENSPIFHVDKVQTPVLIMANDNDGAVPWYQGIEFFSDLRRFQKPAWLLQYNKEAHNLVERRNCKDLSIRLQQFFDHYLKGTPMPAWMKHGVPVWKKDRYFGFENAE